MMFRDGKQFETKNKNQNIKANSFQINRALIELYLKVFIQMGKYLFKI